MGKIIRPTYPAQFSVGLLLLIFIIVTFLSHQIFEVPFHDLNDNLDIYFGMMLAGTSVIIMILIVWEEFLFPVKAKKVEGGLVFRNHRNKLVAQVLIYISIPAIYAYIYLHYEVNMVRYVIWAGICSIIPVIEKIISGINNYNDFLKLTNKEIEYKNNEKVGSFEIKNIQYIDVIKDEESPIKKLKLQLVDNQNVIIDLDEMELEAFYDSIYNFIKDEYSKLLQQS
ncbi:MAG: heavy metal transporter [Bacteroidota bacterium]|nr:heavy metal transporter [Bacteroidota bacterium]